MSAASLRRGLSREEAAAYVGVSTGLFYKLMTEGLMPKPVRIGARSVWDIRSLDLAFDRLSGQGDPAPEATDNEWDVVLR